MLATWQCHTPVQCVYIPQTHQAISTSTSVSSANLKYSSNACSRTYKEEGSGLRKLECLANESLECFVEHCMPVECALAHLRSVNQCQIKQLGFVKSDPMDVALAAFKCIYLDPARPQHHTVAPCQFNANKLSIVEQHGHLEDAKRVWVARPKADDIQPSRMRYWTM